MGPLIRSHPGDDFYQWFVCWAYTKVPHATKYGTFYRGFWFQQERKRVIEGCYAIDNQVHSLRSHDGRYTIDQICKRAVEVGIDELGFTEHKDFDPNDPVVNYFDYDLYLEEIEVARGRWGDRLLIRAGVEIDYQIWFEDRIAAYLDSHSFDFVMGNVHHINGVMLMTPEYNRTRNARTAYSDYFNAVRDSTATGLFDVLGHLEYANRRGIAAWGLYDARSRKEELFAIFDTMMKHEMTLEINTAGLLHGIGMTYPCEETLRMYVERGGNSITIGSDAHQPDHLAYRYEKAVEMVRSCGITEVTGWAARRAVLNSLTPN